MYSYKDDPVSCIWTWTGWEEDHYSLQYIAVSMSQVLSCNWYIAVNWYVTVASVTKVQFETGLNLVRTPNRTQSSIPGSTFSQTQTAGPVQGFTISGFPESFENAVQTCSNTVQVYFLSLTFTQFLFRFQLLRCDMAHLFGPSE